MKIKNIVLMTLSLLVGFIALTIGNKITIASSQSDLLTINRILHEEENITINEWSLHAREKLEDVQSLKDVKDYQKEIKEVFPEGKWEEVKNHQSVQMKMTFSDTTFMEESIIISISLTTESPSTYIIYEVKGEETAEKDMKRVNKEINEKISSIFRGKPAIFSCIKGEFSDKMNETLPYYVTQLLDAFQANTIEALEEEDFVSTSAYTPIFKESIDNQAKEMNFQLGIRTHGMGEKTTFVVGTPIITIEY